MARAARVVWIEPSLQGVAAASLPAAEKRAVWSHIQRTDPALAAALTSPGVVRDLVQQFGASPVVSREFVKEALAHADAR